MFRDHTDPLYYDPNAPPKIFVPVVPQESLTEEQKTIVESFPAEDRGEVQEYGVIAGTGEAAGNFVEGQGSNLAAMIEVDEVEAALKRHKLKEEVHKAKLERRKRD